MKLFYINALLGVTTVFLDFTHSEVQKAQKIDAIKLSHDRVKSCIDPSSTSAPESMEDGMTMLQFKT